MDGPLRVSGFGVVMGEEFWVRFHSFLKALLQEFGNALVTFLPGALQERLIGGVLDQGMLEDVPRAREATALV